MKRKLESICPDDDNLRSGGTPPMMTTTRTSTIIPPHGLPTPFISNFHIASGDQQPFANNNNNLLSAGHSMMLQSATATMNQQQQQPQQQSFQFTSLGAPPPPQQLISSSVVNHHSLPTPPHWPMTTTVVAPVLQQQQQQQANHWVLPTLSHFQQQQQQPQLNHLPQYSQYHHHHQGTQLYASSPPFQQAMISPNMQIPSFAFTGAAPAAQFFPISSFQMPFIQPERVYEAMDTRFNELPSDVVSIMIDFIPLGSQTILKFILTNSMVCDTFKNHRYFAYHQFRSTIIPSMLQCLCSDKNPLAESELLKLISVIKGPLEKIRVEPMWAVKKESWEKWVANDRSIPCPESNSVSLKHRQSIYDKFYGLVTFEMSKKKYEKYDQGTKRYAQIRIGTKIVLSFKGKNTDRGHKVGLTINDGNSRLHFAIDVENLRRRPYNPESSSVLKFKESLGLKDIFIDQDDMVDLILFALPFGWDEVGYY